ncbi:type IV secretion system protein [Lysobacter firmicutimachus]|uniref:Type IV secretion system protein n=1 Tax=Lysobacter firmicutimachus TaxID=1792846 RepID=A0AAU8MYA1_9GAMM
MATPEMTRIAHFLLENVPETVTAYVNEKSTLMIAYIGPAAVALLTIFVLLWGLAMASGQISEPFTEGMRRIVRMCIIVGLALTAGIYQNYVADFFLKVPSEMASELAYEGSSSGHEPITIATVLDGSLQKGFDVGDRAWDKGDEMAQKGIKAAIAGLGYYALAIIVYFVSVGIVAIAAAMLFVAYIAVAILLAVGPFFILLAIFPTTLKFFESWLGQVVNLSILYIMVAVAVGLVFSMFDQYLAMLPISTLSETVVNSLKLVGITIAILAVLLQTRSLASALGGGVSLTAQNVAGKLASMGTDLTRSAVRGDSRRTIAPNVNGARAAAAAGLAVKKGLELARKRAIPRNTISAQ